MRNIFLYSLIALFTVGLSVNDATAGRFGGGRGFSSIRSNTLFSRAYTKRPAQAAAATRANPSKMRGVFTGMLMGGLLASLFMGHGFGGALMSWFFLGMIVLLVMRLIQRKKQTDHYRSHRDL